MEFNINKQQQNICGIAKLNQVPQNDIKITLASRLI